MSKLSQENNLRDDGNELMILLGKHGSREKRERVSLLNIPKDFPGKRMSYRSESPMFTGKIWNSALDLVESEAGWSTGNHNSARQMYSVSKYQLQSPLYGKGHKGERKILHLSFNNK